MYILEPLADTCQAVVYDRKQGKGIMSIAFAFKRSWVIPCVDLRCIVRIHMFTLCMHEDFFTTHRVMCMSLQAYRQANSSNA